MSDEELIAINNDSKLEMEQYCKSPDTYKQDYLTMEALKRPLTDFDAKLLDIKCTLFSLMKYLEDTKDEYEVTDTNERKQTS